MKLGMYINNITCIIALAAALSLNTGVCRAASMIVEAVETEGSGKILPRILSQTPPNFPPSLARAGVKGTVIVTFTVDEAGNVRDAEVTSSDVRQLNPYALKAVETWKFIPGARSGQTAHFRLRGTVEFSPKGNSDRGNQVSSSEIVSALKPSPAPSSSASAEMPSPLPAKQTTSVLDGQPTVPKRKATPVYPYEMLISGQAGWADASFVVDYVGRPLFASPAGASDRAFALALVAMVEASVYNPTRKGKVPVMTPAKEHYEFAGEKSLDSEARRILSELRKSTPSILSSTELDERPKIVQQVTPAYPRALKNDGLTGQAEIEFIIDSQGRVLFPRIVSASHEDFGWAAATAVAQWRFQPPQKNGRGVETRMTVPVLFTAQALADAD